MEHHEQYNYSGTYQDTQNVWENRANNSDDNIAPGRERIADELKKLMLDMATCVDMEDYEGMIRVSYDVVNFEKKDKKSPSYSERFTSFISGFGGGGAESARMKIDAHAVARELTQQNSLCNQAWSCQHCTTDNEGDMINCLSCGKNRGMPADNHQHHLLVNANQNYQRRAEKALWVCDTCESENPTADKECGTCGQEREDNAVTGMNNIASSDPQISVNSSGPAQGPWSCDTCQSENAPADRECGTCSEERQGGLSDSVDRMSVTPVKVQQQVTERVGTDEQMW